jgi:hypothetical protein
MSHRYLVVAVVLLILVCELELATQEVREPNVRLLDQKN